MLFPRCSHDYSISIELELAVAVTEYRRGKRTLVATPSHTIYIIHTDHIRSIIYTLCAYLNVAEDTRLPGHIHIYEYIQITVEGNKRECVQGEALENVTKRNGMEMYGFSALNTLAHNTYILCAAPERRGIQSAP